MANPRVTQAALLTFEVLTPKVRQTQLKTDALTQAGPKLRVTGTWTQALYTSDAYPTLLRASQLVVSVIIRATATETQISQLGVTAVALEDDSDLLLSQFGVTAVTTGSPTFGDGTLRHRHTAVSALVAHYDTGGPAIRVTHASALAAFIPFTKTRVTTASILIANFPEPKNRHSAAHALIAPFGGSKTRVTQSAILVALWPGAVRVTHTHALLSVRKPMLTDCLTTVCYMWRITRKDGVIKRFTAHNRDVTWNGDVYKACSSFDASEVESTRGMAVDNLEVAGILDTADISREDLFLGKYDYAKVEIFIVDWLNTTTQRHILRVGTIGEVRIGHTQFFAELRGLLQRAQVKFGPIYTATCRATLGDAQCKVNLAGFTYAGLAVSEVINDRRFKTNSSLPASAQVNNWFRYGTVTFTSGPNNTLIGEVKKSTFTASGPGITEFELWQAMPFTVAAGHLFTAVAGCNKQEDICVTKFANLVNFRGFPHIPGLDKALIYPDSHVS